MNNVLQYHDTLVLRLNLDAILIVFMQPMYINNPGAM